MLNAVVPSPGGVGVKEGEGTPLVKLKPEGLLGPPNEKLVVGCCACGTFAELPGSAEGELNPPRVALEGY